MTRMVKLLNNLCEWNCNILLFRHLEGYVSFSYFPFHCAGFVMICATIVSVLGILLESALAWLSAIPAGFLGNNFVLFCLHRFMLLYVISFNILIMQVHFACNAYHTFNHCSTTILAIPYVEL